MDEIGAAFGGLVQQVASIAIGLRGMSQVLGAASSAIGAFGQALSAGANVLKIPLQLLSLSFEAVGESIGNIIKSTVNVFLKLGEGVVQATKGLFELGMAATPGGLKIFGQVMEYLTNVIGQVAVPLFVAFTAAIATVADMLDPIMKDAAKSVGEWMVNNLVPAIVKVANLLLVDLPCAIKLTIEWFTNLYEGIKRFVDYIVIGAKLVAIGFLELVSQIEGAINILMRIATLGIVNRQRNVSDEAEKSVMKSLYDQMQRMLKENEERDNRKPIEKGKPIQEGDLFGALGKFISNFQDVTKATRTEMAKQANVGYTGLLDIHKQIQMQSFKNSFEQRTLAIQERSAHLLEVIAAALGKRGVQTALVGAGPR